MPTPRENEEKADFIARCIRYSRREGYPPKEAQGRCFGIWRHSKKKK